MIYPWHESAWQTLTEKLNIPNAWLFYGQEGIGKTAFANHLSALLLCENPQNNQACRQCSSCHLHAQEMHPDFYQLSPIVDEENSRKLAQIKVDEVRQMIEKTQLSPLRAPRRVVLIYPAESLNLQAANALLKILEEPSETIVFILISHYRDQLLPTIKSRCRQFLLPTPDKQTALNFLQENADKTYSEAQLAFHSGAPLFHENDEELTLRDDLITLLNAPRVLAILDFAAHFDRQKKPLALFLAITQKWILDLIACRQNYPARFYPNQQEQLQKLAQRCQTRTLFLFYEQLLALIPYGQHTLNVKLNTEAILLDYLKLFIK